eukprot:m.324239 g.324239  ORF g.324239 m.324239 type:complete len:585 (-) comp16541_c0_seq4:1659-3413(-)
MTPRASMRRMLALLLVVWVLFTVYFLHAFKKDSVGQQQDLKEDSNTEQRQNLIHEEEYFDVHDAVNDRDRKPSNRAVELDESNYFLRADWAKGEPVESIAADYSRSAPPKEKVFRNGERCMQWGRYFRQKKLPDDVVCRYTLAPNKALQCCCSRPTRNGKGKENKATNSREIICMPNVIVIGSQKSGSTALLGHILLHKNFKGPTRKEAHFFDNVYTGNPIKNTAEMPSEMKRTKGKGRSFSFYMNYFPKYRSLPEAQNYITGEATPSYILRTEAPAIVSEVLPHVKLLLILRNPVDRAYSEYQMKFRRVMAQFDPSNAGDIIPLTRELARCHHERWQQRSNEKKASPFTMCALDATRRSKKIMKLFRGRDVHVKNFVKMMVPPNLRTLRSKITNFIQKMPRETLDELGYTMRGEMNYVKRFCMRPRIPGQPLPPGNDSSTTPDIVRFDWGGKDCWPRGSKSNIKLDFVIRGLYHEQIVQWHRYFPKSQLLILTDIELRNDPKGTMDKVFRFAGLTPLKDANYSAENIENVISEQWPRFEEDTGWRYQSQYPPLDQDLRREMATFYRPHNMRLENYLQRKLNWD